MAVAAEVKVGAVTVTFKPCTFRPVAGSGRNPYDAATTSTEESK